VIFNKLQKNIKYKNYILGVDGTDYTKKIVRCKLINKYIANYTLKKIVCYLKNKIMKFKI